jgi:hypothetical protein
MGTAEQDDRDRPPLLSQKCHWDDYRGDSYRFLMVQMLFLPDFHRCPHLPPHTSKKA